jgi:hypothetical protein
MTSSAAAAAQLAKALSPSEQQLSVLKEYADLCDIQAVVVNRLTKLDLKKTRMFDRTIQFLNNLLKSIYAMESLTVEQRALYRELMVLKNTIDLYGSCGFSALWIVSQAMSENDIKSGVFGGHEGVFHFGRPAWSGESNKFGNVLSSMNQEIQKMAKWAGVQQGKNEEVEDFIFEARLENLRDDSQKLTGIDRLVQAFADNAAREILAKLPPAGSKNCRQA